MLKAAILAGLCLVVAGLLILLNPRLLVPATAGVLLGVALRRAWLWLAERRAPRPATPPNARRSGPWRRIVLLLGVVLSAAAVVVLMYMGTTVLSPASGSVVVSATLTYTANYDAARATWTATERFDLSDDAVTEALRLLRRAGRQVPSDATPDDVVALLEAEFGGAWIVALDTGRPTMTGFFEIETPEGGPWSYDVSLPLAVPRSRVFEVRPADAATAILDTPRNLVLQAAPAIATTEALPGDPRETLRIDLPKGSTAVRLDVAPGWARHDVTAWAMTLSLGSLTPVGVGVIAAVLAAAFGTTVWSRMKSLRPQRPSPAGASAATTLRSAPTFHSGGASDVDSNGPPKPERQIKILFLASNPVDTDPLLLDEEIRSIDEALRMAEFRDRFEIEQQWAVRIGDLQEALLRHEPDIVHFSGHGTESSEIVLQTESGESQAVPQDDLSRLFSILRDNIRCVVLNACYSEQQAQAIAEHIDCVVGMTTAVGDDAAIEFATAFYRAIGYGRDVQTAFDLGTNQIGLQGLPDVDTPHLVARKVPAAEVRFVASA